MQCPACSHDNAPDARFCSQCGVALDLRCPSCGTGHAQEDRFCSQCGARLTGPRDAGPGSASAADGIDDADLSRYVPPELLRRIRATQVGDGLRGERRTVTMLFADIQGSTAAAQHLDPEDWAEIMNGAFSHLIAPVHRFEGTLARLQGDAILAFFGAPIAHEDDPDRAVRAGLQMLDAIEEHRAEVEGRHGVSIGVRVGINTGLVVVGEVGSDLRVEYTALGDAINVAARMEQTAAPGTVRITDETRALLGPEFVTESIGPVTVRGRSDAVLAHRVTGTRQSGPRGGDATTTLVGRTSEREALHEVLARTGRGEGGIAVVVGEAGIGKSRLLQAVRDQSASVRPRSDQPSGIAWLQAQATAYDRAVPHAVVVDLLRSWWGHPDTTTVFDRVLAAVGSATGEDDRDTAAVLTSLLDGELPEDQQRFIDGLAAPVLHERTTRAVVDYLVAEAGRRPLAVVIDDLHWADAMSLALVEQLMAVTARSPIALVLLLRPQREDPAWRVVEAASERHADRAVTLTLDPLDDDATTELLHRLLTSVELAEDVRVEVLRRADGNPLFLEELVRSLGDVGAAEASGATPRLNPHHIDVPPSLSGLLTARLDQLDEPSRHVAQVASVIGQEFELGTLEAASDTREDLPALLEDLLRRGILEARGREAEPSYWFRHALLHDAAYSTVLLRTRRELHARIATHLAAHAPDRARQIATHWLEAGRPADALPFLVTAGQRALRAMALSDAFAAFEAAINAADADADPTLVLDAHRGLGEAHSLVPDLPGATAAYQSLLDVGRSNGDPSLQVAALNSLGYAACLLGGDFDGALGYLHEARDLAEEIGDELGLAEYHMNACFVNSMSGNVDRAAEHDEQTRRIGERLGNEVVRMTGLVRGAANLLSAGRFDEAAEAYGEAVEVAADMGQEELVAVLQTFVHSQLLLRDGQLDAALEQLRTHLPTLDRYSSFYAAVGHHRMGEAASLRGDLEDALTAYGAAARFGEALHQPFGVATGVAGQARLLAEAGLLEGLDERRAAAEAALAEQGADYYSTSAWTDLGHLELARGDAAAATELLHTALASSSATRAWELPRARFGLARAALADGDTAAARAALEAARADITARGLRIREPELFLLDGAIALHEDRAADATTLLTAAVAAASELGTRLTRIEALRLLADLRRRAGELDEADTLAGRADSTVRQVSSRIADPRLSASLQRRLERSALGRPTG